MDNPFEGLPRKRVPGMHMITACEGGAELPNALAAYFWLMMHDRWPHRCLIREAQEKRATAVSEAASHSSEPGLCHIFGAMAGSGLILQEWSYITDGEAFTAQMMAGAAIEQVQRWIAEGSREPFKIPLGPLVERPRWAEGQFGNPDSAERQEPRAYVKRLEAEVAEVVTHV